MTASSALTSLGSPKTSTLRKIEAGSRVVVWVAAVGLLACALAAPPTVAIAASVYLTICMASITSRIFLERREHKEEVAVLKAEIETLRNADYALAA